LSQTYLIALGSNMRTVRAGPPRRVLAAALGEMEARGFRVLAAAPIVESAPVGPSRRRYANSAALVACECSPPEALRVLQAIERDFGRSRAQRMGQRWRARSLDLDIVLWSGGIWMDPALTIPHCELRGRDFVLGPASGIAGKWRDPVSGLSLAQLRARLAAPRKT
jgi:2-amino-4-hydroxy-6-hydroxymethyldihydropteridine diphosphokinase